MDRIPRFLAPIGSFPKNLLEHDEIKGHLKLATGTIQMQAQHRALQKEYAEIPISRHLISNFSAIALLFC
ncbi:hypothetical protein HQ40_01640 [Porphyromonas gulae]|nr:hypothetical protein HQ40_01640 [Porphyromonas gulae]KGO02243.1 hypothetical protein HQ42_07490 [Porphyromonas gulae]